LAPDAGIARGRQSSFGNSEIGERHGQSLTEGITLTQKPLDAKARSTVAASDLTGDLGRIDELARPD